MGAKNSKNNLHTVVLKADLHCDGCASKVLKCIRTFDGVESATIGEGLRLITVAGKFDPTKLREKVEQKTHKRVEVISIHPKNENNNKNINEENNSHGENKENVKGKENNGGNEKSKETNPHVTTTTAVMKIQLHCEGCIQKIHKIVTKTKGYQEIKIDRLKELVTVTGAMDMKALADVLKKHLKKDIEIVLPKKETEKKDNTGGSGKAKNDNGGEKKNKSGGGGGGGDMTCGGEEKVMEEKDIQFHAPPGGGGELIYYYNPFTVGPCHAPQIFSDENPNACSVM